VTIQEAACTAIAAQDAVNLSGVLHTFSEIVSEVIWPEARKQGKGTDFVNRHCIVTLFLHKLCDLNGGSFDADYTSALVACSEITRTEVQS
jgi:hypothetical protein